MDLWDGEAEGIWLPQRCQGSDKDHPNYLATVPKSEAQALWNSKSSEHSGSITEVTKKGSVLSLPLMVVDEGTRRISGRKNSLKVRDTEGKCRWGNR